MVLIRLNHGPIRIDLTSARDNQGRESAPAVEIAMLQNESVGLIETASLVLLSASVWTLIIPPIVRCSVVPSSIAIVSYRPGGEIGGAGDDGARNAATLNVINIICG